MVNIFKYLKHTPLILRNFFRETDQSKETVEFVCTFCGVREDIPKSVVEHMDLTDRGGDLSYPPRFACSACPDGCMQPIDYTSPSGRIYKTDPKSIKPARIIPF